MQIVTYLGFTLLSIFIQFSVIDFIQGRLKVDENPVDAKGVSQKRQLRDVLKDVRPHALYYRNKDKGIKYVTPAKFISNISLSEFLVTTDLTTTVFDVMYEENSTSTDESYTTESLFTTTEFDNVTEITFLEKTNGSTKTDTVPTKKSTEKCDCNFLIMVCDINCCCDPDCLDAEIKLFPNCMESKIAKTDRNQEYCLPQLPYFGYGNGLFCIVKVNLPENKKVFIQKTEPVPINNYLTWKSNERSQVLYEFSNSLYKYGDPIWLNRNGTIYHADLPVASATNYCTGRKAMQFLKDETYRCNVKIQDLEMLPIMKSLEEVSVISATPLSMNSSVLNCSTLHCVNWTIVICKNLLCTNYNKSLHEPECTETVCTNLALKIGYTFYYHDLKIVNASIKFHIQNMTLSLPLLTQEIQVKFVVGNRSIDKALKLSGNPGYLDGFPVIFSQAESNYTDSFYNSTNTPRYWILPENEYGLCNLLNNSENFILFGRNRRLNCRYNHKIVKFSNATDECRKIQNSINRFLDFNEYVMVSPLGDPKEIEDKNWISVERHISQSMLYGTVREKSSKLLCFNFVPRYSVTFGYAQMNGIYRIVSASYSQTAKNVTFNMDDISTVITVDINFIDVMNPSVFEHVKRTPSLNIHLPDDFFYPFRNESPSLKCNVFILIYLIPIISCK